jgi:excisionase family DNA binding protein
MEKIKNSDITLLTEREAAKIIAVSYNKLRYLRQQGKIGFCRIGHSIKYRLSDLQKLIECGIVEASV